MKPAPFLPFVLAVFVAVSALSCKNFKTPELKGIEKLNIEKMGIKESIVHLKVHYFNANNFRVKLKKAEGNAWIDGKALGHFTMDSLIKIGPKSDFWIPVKLKLDMSHFVENMAAAFLGKQVMLKINGTARVGKGFLFMNYPLEYEGKQSLESWLK